MALRVTDLERTRSFCVDALGFEPIEHHQASDVATVIDHEGDSLLLAGPAAGDLEPRLAVRHAVFEPGETLVFRQSALDAFREQVVTGGADDATLTETSWGDRTLTVLLPDDYTFKFTDKAELSDDQVLALYAQGPDVLESALQNVTDSDLERRDHLGWTMRMLVHHIIDGDVLWAGAVFASLVQPGTEYSHDWYTTDAQCAAQLHYEERDISTALALFRASREHQMRMIRDIPDSLERGISLRRRYEGSSTEMSLKEILRRRAVHSLEHIEEVVQLRRA